MPIITRNQKPAVLDPVHTLDITGDYDPIPTLRSTIVDPLMQPLQPAAPVVITDASGTDLIPDIPQMIMRCVDEQIDVDAEKQAKELLGQTLLHFDQATALPTQELFAIQAGQRHKLPAPGPRVVYSATDVVPAAKGMLAGTTEPDELFANLAFAFHPNTLGFWMRSEADFEDVKASVATWTQTHSATLPSQTRTLLDEFQTLSLNGLTESLQLRRSDSDNNDERSFARIIIRLLMDHILQQRTAGTDENVGVLPFTVGELFCPRSIVIMNVETHARASALEVSKEWAMINAALASPIKVVSHRTLSKLTALPRAAARATMLNARKHAGQPGSRSATVVFRKMPPARIDLFSDIMRVIRRMHIVNKSMNVMRTVRNSYLKPNRRDPHDINRPGRITTVQYLPDIHLYIDTSGSISEANYQQMVTLLIAVAKKLGVNLYFNTFSHILSQETLLRVENRSERQIWQAFRRVPKVTGLTDYQQIWDYINASSVRKRRLSLVITDFEWTPPPTRENHPKNLYYAPCSAMDWTDIVDNADRFADAMRHIDPSIRQKMLGLIA